MAPLATLYEFMLRLQPESTGGAAGPNTVNFSSANTASTFVTYVGGSGADTITGSNGRDNTVTLGDGTNSFTSHSAGTTGPAPRPGTR